MSLLQEELIESIAKQFDIGGDVVSVKRFGSGHINDTFKVEVKSLNNTSYLLQRINHHIFKDVDGLMNNISLVTNHLKSTLEGQVDDVDKYTLTIVPTQDQQLYNRSADGDYWRIFILLEGTKSYDILEHPSRRIQEDRLLVDFKSNWRPWMPINWSRYYRIFTISI